MTQVSNPTEEAAAPLPHPNSARPAIFLQDACLQHRYIRSRDTSAIVERPERLRAVTIGLAAAIARVEHALTDPPNSIPVSDLASGKTETEAADDLAAALDRMNLAPTSSGPVETPMSIVQSQASIDILNHPAVKFIHGDVDGDVYLKKLKSLVADSAEKIKKGESEIPEGLSQGDLYLCPESLTAIQGALGTVCEAVDAVVASSRNSVEQAASPFGYPVNRAFVAIRPPGHHCGEDSPSGFCFVNNVAVGAAHAHLEHGINRIVILDIDLHHGNGTQAIVWQINEETYRLTLEAEEGAPPSKPGPQIYYGSIHDILSYPCEDGKPNLVQAASTSIHKSHGQYIENIHLQTYTSEKHFWGVLYKEQYSRLLRKAEEFLDHTGGPGDDVMIFISCGMDACEHEYESMSRHNRKVPTSFYYRFARDACAFSDQYARGRLVSVLEGGYSDRALTSGAMAHLSGLTNTGVAVDEDWWSLENLVKLEKATKKRRGGRQSLIPAVEPWLERTLAIFATLDPGSGAVMTPSSSRSGLPLPPSTRSLRERKKPASNAPTSTQTSNKPKHGRTGRRENKPGPPADLATSNLSEDSSVVSAAQKVPRVILRLGPRPGA